MMVLRPGVVCKADSMKIWQTPLALTSGTAYRAVVAVLLLILIGQTESSARGCGHGGHPGGCRPMAMMHFVSGMPAQVYSRNMGVPVDQTDYYADGNGAAQIQPAAFYGNQARYNRVVQWNGARRRVKRFENPNFQPRLMDQSWTDYQAPYGAPGFDPGQMANNDRPPEPPLITDEDMQRWQ